MPSHIMLTPFPLRNSLIFLNPVVCCVAHCVDAFSEFWKSKISENQEFLKCPLLYRPNIILASIFFAHQPLKNPLFRYTFDSIRVSKHQIAISLSLWVNKLNQLCQFDKGFLSKAPKGHKSLRRYKSDRANPLWSHVLGHFC